MEAALDHRPEPAGYAPRALGSGDPLDRAELLAAPLKTLPRPSILDAPITKLRGAGPKLGAAAEEMGIASLGDLLRHLPHGYRDRAEPVGLADLRLGEEATVEVEVIRAKVRPTRRRRLTILEADVRDASGADEGHLVQPRLARRSAAARARGSSCTASSRSAASTSPSTSFSTRRRRASTPPGSSPFTRRASACARSAFASGPGRRSRRRATRSSRFPAACAGSCGWRVPRTRWPPRTSPRTSTPPRRRASASPSRSSSSTRRRWSPGAAAVPRATAGSRCPSAARVSATGSARCRSS